MMTKYPVGFYALGKTAEPMTTASNPDVRVREWSTQGVQLLEPGRFYDFQVAIENTTRIETVHCWGFCRIVQVSAGNYGCEEKYGSLFVRLGRTVEVGYELRVRVQALEVDNGEFH